jgi:hypothetical protein
MTKTIKNIIQNDSGGTNPDTHAHEDKVWELQFEDEDSAVLTKGKMLEYLTKGTVPVKTVHSFKKWDIITTLGHTTRTWVVVYDDKSHVQLANKDFYSLLTHGHTTINGEEVTEIVEGERGAISSAIAQVQKEAGTSPKTLTTPEEQLELEEFREDAMRDNYSPVFGKKEESDIEE